MTPKDYFFKNFDNAVGGDSTSNDELLKMAIDYFFNKPEYIKALRTEYPFSNDYLFNKTITELKKKEYRIVKDPIYVGKLKNSMPNCYLVNSDDIDGCLICYTTGMSENVYLFAQLIMSMCFGRHLGVNEDVLEAYIDILVLELERRIHYWYGGKIASNLILNMEEELLEGYNIDKLQDAATFFSAFMDTLLIYHEFAHYILRNDNSSKKTSSRDVVLLIRAFDLYDEFFEDENLERPELPDDEIIADFMALLLLTEGKELNHVEIIGVFIAFLQLKKMSDNDKYTNEFRFKVADYFFRDNWAYQNLKDVINEAIEFFLEIIEDACAVPYDYRAYSQRVDNAMTKISKMSTLSEAQKTEIYNFYINFFVKRMEIEEKMHQDTDSSDFENFEPMS